MSEGTAFDSLRPPVTVTDPQGLAADGVYPKHLHQAGVADDGGPRYVVVRTPQEEAEAVAAGWLDVKPGPGAARPAVPEAPPPRRR